MAAERLRQKFVDMKIRLDQAEARTESFKESLKEVNGRIDNAEANAATLRRQATIAEVELKRIAVRLDDVEDRVLQADDRLKRKEETVSTILKEEAQLSAQQGELTDKLKAVKDNVTLNESTLNEAQRRIKVVELQKKLAENRCERLADLGSELNRKLAVMSKRIEELQGNARSGMSAQEEFALDERIAELKNSYKESAMKAEMAQKKVTSLTYQRHLLGKELKEITDKQDRAQDELNRIYNEFGVST